MAEKATVWIVDAEQWPRACLRAELIERGYDAIGFWDLRLAAKELRREDLARPAVIVLDPKAMLITVDERLALERAAIPLVLIGGAIESAEPFLRGLPRSKVVRRPVTVGEVADAVEVLVRGA